MSTTTTTATTLCSQLTKYYAAYRCYIEYVANSEYNSFLSNSSEIVISLSAKQSILSVKTIVLSLRPWPYTRRANLYRKSTGEVIRKMNMALVFKGIACLYTCFILKHFQFAGYKIWKRKTITQIINERWISHRQRLFFCVLSASLAVVFCLSRACVGYSVTIS